MSFLLSASYKAQLCAYRRARQPAEHDFSMTFMAPSQESFRERSDKISGLTTRESVELFQEAHDKAIDEAHSTFQQSLTGADSAGEIVKPKLTLDLRKRNLSQIPKEVVAIIGQDVERYELSFLAGISWPVLSCSSLQQCWLLFITKHKLSLN